MDVALIVIPSVVFGIAIPLMAWILKTLYDTNARQAADEVRWGQQDDYWKKNAEDHTRAFREIADLKKVQALSLIHI